ncbi:uncharacterized protein LOC117327391 [Pecten maximus]|uniref:uncharacterized protein LOC117327391 n=1 Tax=Pecten maximus TaxID=6579 RepID=UPI0014582595|nr:uncharacterized protein LOC117327391 [Pecten maximus]
MNQVVLVPVVVLSSILLLTAPVAVDAADTCVTGNANQKDCCAAAGCGWYECSYNATSPVKACLNKTDHDTINKTCPGSTDSADLNSKCDAAQTGCSALNETTCCSESECGLYKCDTAAGCWNSSDVNGYKAYCESSNKTADLTDTCPGTTDPCLTNQANSSCCSADGCGWFQCKDADDKLIGNATCLTNTTTNLINCTSPATPKDTCKDVPTPTPAPLLKCRN